MYALHLGALTLAVLTLTFHAEAGATTPTPTPTRTTVEPPPPDVREPLPVPPAPPPLSVKKRASALKRAFSLIGATAPKPGPTPEDKPLVERITPVNQRLESGTRVTAAYGVTYIDASAEAPGGLYSLLGDGDDHRSGVRMRVHTEQDRLYVGECEVKGADYPGYTPPDTVKIKAPGLYQDFKISNGRVLFAFRGEASGSTVELIYNEDKPGYYRWVAFYGCEFSPAG
jgi:hypothetical protein